MDIGDMRDVLASLDPEAVVHHGFGNPHSWRGIYAEAAVEPQPDTTIGEMIACLDELASGQVFEGWKGGDFCYDRGTPLHLSFEGESTEQNVAIVIADAVMASVERGQKSKAEIAS